MKTYRVVGIDPALTNVGLCVLESEKPGRYLVAEHGTLTTKPRMLILDRLDAIRLGVESFLSRLRGVRVMPVVIENPTSNAGTAARTKRQGPQSIGVTGQAVGVVVASVLAYCDRPLVYFITPDLWMPKQKSGNFTHIMAKPLMARYLHSVIKAPAGCTEHELMAAGVARFWIETQRMAERLAG